MRACKKRPDCPPTDAPIEVWKAFLLPLERSMSANTELREAIAQEKHRLLRAQADKAELELAESKVQVVEVSRVLESLRSNMERMRAQLDSAFRSELPARLGGMPADKIALENGRRLDEIYEALSKII